MHALGQRHRYLVVLPRGKGNVFLSWRLLSTDRPLALFHVERRGDEGWQRVTSEPIGDSTNFLDRAPLARGYEYRVIAADGSLGGFGPGLPAKRLLLGLEGSTGRKETGRRTGPVQMPARRR